MPKIKLTKGELKKQRDALKQYERYLPTLQLKKQQLQIEILHQTNILESKEEQEAKRRSHIEVWAGLLSEPGVSLLKWIKPVKEIILSRNIAGVDLPVFDKVEFLHDEYDLFAMPFWIDTAIEDLRDLVSVRCEIKILKEGIAILKRELQITTQRVNLFEKVKIPESLDAIRLIKIYIGDQLTNAVGRSKMAKRKIENLLLEEVAA